VLAVFEIDMGDEVTVVVSSRAALVRHRKQCYFVALRAHEFHKFKQVDFGSAERKVIFVAVQDFHDKHPPQARRSSPRRDRRSVPGSYSD